MKSALLAAVCGIAISVFSHTASATILVADDFDGNTVNAPLFASKSNATITTGICGGEAGNGLNFSGSGNRSATTNVYDLSGADHIKIWFDLRIGTVLSGGGECENVDNSGETVEFQMDTGSGFDVVEVFGQNSYPTFEPVHIYIDGSLLTSTTSFRWIQRDGHEGSNFDEWAIDNVRIDVPEPGTLALFGLGLAGLGLSRRKRMV